MNTTGQIFGMLLLALSTFACATAPPAPERPDAPDLTDSFSISDPEALASVAISADWWQRFEDSQLVLLVETALSENKDLALAAANIETARSIQDRQRLNQSFSTSSSASADLGRAARDGADTELTGSGQLGASWELDAFDRISAAIESAAFQVEQLEEIQRDVAVTVAAETALAYVDYRGNQVRLDVARANAELQGESVDLLKVLFDNGRATRLDLERAEAQYRTTLASLPLLELNILSARIRMAVLTGRTDMNMSDLIGPDSSEPARIPSPPTSLGIGTPQDLVRRRPDIRAAEAEISRRLALGQVERARLFPTITFNANLLSLFTEDNAGSDSFGFGVGPAIRWDGPDLRRVGADIDIADAETRAAYAAYERAVVDALGEVELALAAYTQERARRDNLEAAAESASRALELARLRFDEGLDDFLDVIDAQRTLLDAQDRLESNRLSTTRQAIATYRVLGGIWQTDEIVRAVSESE
nr:TolC family protein [Hyphomonas sp. Mor2]